MKKRLLDLFCGAGGAAMGYYRAGFEIVGVDIEKQPHYPFEFHQADAFDFLEGHWKDFDVIHLSPPCQRFSVLTPEHSRKNHFDFFDKIYSLLDSIGKPFIIENVPPSRKRMRNPILLCGSMFGLPIFRHRFFDTYPHIGLVPCCNHNFIPVLISGTPRRKGFQLKDSTVEQKRLSMGIAWMSTRELDQAIPPDYTEFIGKRMLKIL